MDVRRHVGDHHPRRRDTRNLSMNEIELSGNTYRIGKLSAYDQFHVIRRAAPVLGAIAEAEDTLAALTTALGQLPDDVADRILFGGLLKCVTRKGAGGVGWAPIVGGASNLLMFADITLPDMMRLARDSWADNFADFLAGLAATGEATSPTNSPPGVG